MAKLRVLDGSNEIAWLLEGAMKDALDTGVQIPGFAARGMILHAMWEHPAGPGSESFDTAYRASVASGTIEPGHLVERELLERSVSTGIPGGASYAPDGWRRLTWRELARRWDVDLAIDMAVNPISVFRPKLESGSWPVGIQPPPEGSIDWESLLRLVDILEPHARLAEVYRYSAPDTWYGPNSSLGSPPLTVGTLQGLLDGYGAAGSFGSGQNWWPSDHAWLIYTDWDLSVTIVQGSIALVDTVLADTFLETARMNPL